MKTDPLRPQAAAAALLAAALLLAAPSAEAAITVNGLATRTVYTSSVTFTVVAEAGYDTVAEVDGAAVAAGSPVGESRPGYHELFVAKTPAGGGATETLTVQFIIRDPARLNADVGMETWTPRPAVAAPAATLDTTTVRFVAPAAVAPGTSFPLVVRLESAGGRIARLNGTARVTGSDGAASTLTVRRGAGSGAWTAPATPGPLTLSLRLGTRTFTREVAVAAAAVETLAGTLPASRTVAAGSRLAVTGDLAVPAGMTLRFEAGCVVALAAGATIDVAGALEIAGTPAEPVLFLPADPAQAWGGFYVHGGAASASVTGAMLTGAGADQNWISDHGLTAHKPEQPVFAIDGCGAEFTDTWIVDNPLGQAGHGRNATVSWTRCLVERTKTGGQFNNTTFTFTDSHAIEMPVDSPAYVDADNDAFYLTNGTHRIEGSVIGWTKDDGIDCGGDPAATLNVDDCWFEACFHEAFALSGDKVVTITDTVSINNGQGLEVGYSAGGSLARPDATATNSLIVANANGARYGDCYDWTYRGKLAVGSSLLLRNGNDVFGFEWDSWTWRTADMTIEGNVVTAPVEQHPNNATVDPATDAPRVAAFLDQPAAPRGFAVVDRAAQNPRADYGGSIGVHLDRPATDPVAIPWRILAKTAPDSADEIEVAAGTLEFPVAEVFASLDLPALDGPAAGAGWIAVVFDDGAGAVATDTGACHFLDIGSAFDATPVPFGSTWSYLADGSNQGTAWRAPGFDDAGWPAGPGQLGYGDNDEATNVGYVGGSSSKNATTYFRHRFTVADPAAIASLSLDLLYDDGAVVYLNGQRVAAANMPAGEPAYDYYIGTTSSDNARATFVLDPARLVAGANTLAVEVHQESGGSSDISFDLELTATPAAGGSIEAATATLDGRLHLFWSTPGIIPETSPDLHSWLPRPDLASPVVIPPNDPAPLREFIRLRLP